MCFSVYKICIICKLKFIDESLDGRHNQCSKCEDEWDKIQQKDLEIFRLRKSNK